MSNWETTLAGAVTALGVYFETVTTIPWLPTVGTFLQILGTALLGYFAKSITTPSTTSSK